MTIDVSITTDAGIIAELAQFGFANNPWLGNQRESILKTRRT